VVGPGRQLFDEQFSMFQPGKVDALIDRHYDANAVLMSTAIVLRGQNALKGHFHAYLTMFAKIEVLSLDASVLKNGKVTRHFTGAR